jgi:hypothetical protein
MVAVPMPNAAFERQLAAICSQPLFELERLLKAVSGQFLFITRSIGAVSKRAFAVSPVPSLQYVTRQSFALKTRV